MALATVNHVHDLTNDTFRGFVEENDMVLVGFVLPFLPVTERFSREYEEVYFQPICADARKADRGVIHIGRSSNAWLCSTICESRLHRRD